MVRHIIFVRSIMINRAVTPSDIVDFRRTIVSDGMEDNGKDILKGLSQPQKYKVYEWISEFRLSIDELAAWRKDREVFMGSVEYEVPVETPVDLICRDIHEVKQFGVQVSDLFCRNGEPSSVEFCGRQFTQEGVMRWVLISSHLRGPFSFLTGEPQKILNSLSRTRSVRPLTTDRGTRKNKGKPSEDIEVAHRDPMQKCPDRTSAVHARIEVPIPQGVTQSEAIERRLMSTGKKRMPNSKSNNYAEMVEIYLRHFGVEAHDFSEWLIASYGSNLVPQDEVFARADILLTSIAEVLQALENCQTRDKSPLAIFARSIKVSEGALRKWSSPEMRQLFFMDKTALKYELFQKVFPMPAHEEESWLPEVDELISLRGSNDFPDLELFEDPVALVEGILDFYSLDSEALDQLPMECNRGYRERVGGDAPQMLLRDLNSVISHLNEVSMFSRLFSPQEAALYFEKPVDGNFSMRNMYHVSIEDAIGAVMLTHRSEPELEELGKDLQTKVIENQKIKDLLVKYGRE